MPRGGKRDGAGRPAISNKRITLSFSCSPMMAIALDEQVKKHHEIGDKISRSELIEGILLDYFEG